MYLTLQEWNARQRRPRSVTNGAIVIHTQRLKSDPGGNLLS
ncbi:excisionase [Escherichia coli]